MRLLLDLISSEGVNRFKPAGGRVANREQDRLAVDIREDSIDDRLWRLMRAVNERGCGNTGIAGGVQHAADVVPATK